MTRYNLTSSMTDRMQLDEDVVTLADDMGRLYPGDETPTDAQIQVMAEEQCELALDTDSTDDEEEYRARFIAAFTQAFKDSFANTHGNN